MWDGTALSRVLTESIGNRQRERRTLRHGELPDYDTRRPGSGQIPLHGKPVRWTNPRTYADAATRPRDQSGDPRNIDIEHHGQIHRPHGAQAAQGGVPSSTIRQTRLRNGSSDRSGNLPSLLGPYRGEQLSQPPTFGVHNLGGHHTQPGLRTHKHDRAILPKQWELPYKKQPWSQPNVARSSLSKTQQRRRQRERKQQQQQQSQPIQGSTKSPLSGIISTSSSTRTAQQPRRTSDFDRTTATKPKPAEPIEAGTFEYTPHWTQLPPRQVAEASIKDHQHFRQFLHDMQAKGYLRRLHGRNIANQSYLPTFQIPKRDGGFRVIVDCKRHINNCLATTTSEQPGQREVLAWTQTQRHSEAGPQGRLPLCAYQPRTPSPFWAQISGKTLPVAGHAHGASRCSQCIPKH